MTPGRRVVHPDRRIVHVSGLQRGRFGIMGRKNWLMRIRKMSGKSISLDGPGGGDDDGDQPDHRRDRHGPRARGPNPPGTFGRWRITSAYGIAEFRIGGRLNIGATAGPGRLQRRDR